MRHEREHRRRAIVALNVISVRALARKEDCPRRGRLRVNRSMKMNEEEILQNMDYVSEQLVGAAEAIKADTDERRFDEAYDPMLRDVMMMARELLHLRDLLDELREGE